MKSFLVHFAIIAVMVHMTFGCSWHHGFGSAHACTSQNSLSNCCSNSKNPSVRKDSDHDGHHHCDDEHESPSSKSTFDLDDHSSHNPLHPGCQDDGCTVIKTVRFVFSPLDFSVAYLGGAENSAITNNTENSGITVNPYPDYSGMARNLRTHLLLGVQIL